MENHELITGKVYWTKGYEAGVEAERERIIELLLRGDIIHTKTAEKIIRGRD
jgi:hypothetical protein